MNLLGLLIDKGLLSPADRAQIEAEIAKQRPLAEALAERNITMADALAVAGETYGLPVRSLGDPPADEEALGYIPLESAKHYGFVPIGIASGALEVGVVDPDNLEALDALRFISGKIGMPYKIFLISENDFDRVVSSYQNLSGEIEHVLTEYDSTDRAKDAAKEGNVLASITDSGPLDLSGMSEALKEDAPVTKIVSTILRYAIDGRSSDIHVEPTPTKTRVRFRTDGILHTSLELPSKVHEAVIARIKILGQMRLDEKRKPQDGRFSATIDGRRVDFRVSTFPTDYGEKIVMRILDQTESTIRLDATGLGGDLLVQVREAIKAPYGIILMAGPTGSGKSTTLFSMLSELDRESRNVVSLEDPIEYRIPGVAQSQVRPEIGYDFANGLRSILRQDPDVIMVGEIRDKETAALSVQAALTGHLVFSTIHTNSAAGAIPRLVDMGVDPYLIAPTLVAVIGQRLVRKLYPGTGKPFPLSDSLRALVEREFADLPEQYRKNLPPAKQFYHPEPTQECPDGIRGRTGVFELMRMNKKLEDVILAAPVEEKVYTAAREGGMLTMREDAIMRALAGEIPFEDVNTLGGELFPETAAA